MRSEGNCGDGERPVVHEPREPQPHPRPDGLVHRQWGEVAWHQGRTASATGYEASKRRKEVSS